MKKLLFILLGTFTFACGNADNNTDARNNEATTTNETLGDGEVEIGSGDEISPQLEVESDSMLEVDTVSSAKEIHQRQE